MRPEKTCCGAVGRGFDSPHLHQSEKGPTLKGWAFSLCQEAGFQPGDRLGARADGAGRVVLERVTEPIDEFSGALTGMYASFDLDADFLLTTHLRWKKLARLGLRGRLVLVLTA